MWYYVRYYGQIIPHKREIIIKLILSFITYLKQHTLTLVAAIIVMPRGHKYQNKNVVLLHIRAFFV